jgi:hypothetical protein
LLNALWSQGLKDGYISMEIFLYVWKWNFIKQFYHDVNRKQPSHIFLRTFIHNGHLIILRQWRLVIKADINSFLEPCGIETTKRGTHLVLWRQKSITKTTCTFSVQIFFTGMNFESLL